MMWRLRIAVIVAVVGSSGTRGAAQPPVPVWQSAWAALAEALDLAERVERLYREGKFGEAIAPAQRSLLLRERTLGPRDPGVAASLYLLAKLYRAQGKYEKAEPLYVRGLGILVKTFGPTHPGVASGLNSLALLYKGQGKYEKAEPLYVRALGILEKIHGPAQPEVAGCLSNLAGLYLTRGEYGRAEPLYVRALDILEKVLGPTDPSVATVLANLAGLHFLQGDYRKAEALYSRSLEIQGKVLGALHPETARNWNDLGLVYQALGAYEKAEPLLVRALTIQETSLGPTHPDVATNLDNLARLYHDQGAYGKAERFYLRELAILEKTAGAMHPTWARSLNNLGSLYYDQGAYGKAEEQYLRALALLERTVGRVHPDVATTLSNLGWLYQVQGAYAKAEPLMVRALDIRQQALGPTHRDVATSMNNLAVLYQMQGAYAKAEPLLVRALDIRQGVLGPNHPSVAASMNNLAMLYRAQGAYGKAESLYRHALAIDQNAPGPVHPDVTTIVANLAWLYRVRGDPRRAIPLEVRAAENRERELRVELAPLSEPRKRAFMRRAQVETESVVSLHVDQMPGNPRALELALTTVLRRKGRILDSLVEQETLLRAHLAPRLRAQLDLLSQSRAELVARLYAPPGRRRPTDRSDIQAVRARIDALESELSAASAEFRARSAPVSIAQIQAALPPGAALVELFRYRRVEAPQRDRWREARYVAYLVTRDGPPRWVALGPADAIDAGVEAVLTAMRPRIASEVAKGALRHLDALVFAPIRARLPEVSHLIVAPDGALNLVPFEALVDPQGHYALERYLVSYVTTGRDLLRLGTRGAPGSPGVILAAPDYGPAPTSKTAGTVSFAPLAGAMGEAMDLRRYFAAAPLTGRSATKAALAGLTRPTVLHLATHGFYARDAAAAPGAPGTPAREPMPREGERGLFVEGSPEVSLSPPVDDGHADGLADSLDRAGLALAGANQGPQGIVTAREIAGLDWWGTQLVVLSACETGVGAVASGDGVYGLRRALVLAGAESQVVSLWNVSDSTARELMRDYYRELAAGAGRAAALRTAKLHMVKQPGRAHPYYWATFIAAGDWRPLERGSLRENVSTAVLGGGG